MLEYKLHEFSFGERFYVLLPKMCRAQSEALASRLAKKGFAVQKSTSMVAKRKGATIHIDPSGFCWSNADPADAIAPAIPGILGLPKETVALEELRSLYFRLGRSGGSFAVRFSTRIESSGLWKALRAGDSCGLTPDEHSVLSFVINASSGGCRLLTDFPTEGARTRIVGGCQYFESLLDPSEAVSALRVVGKRGERNSYLPRDGILLFETLRLPSRAKQAELFNSLGEWCYLRAS